MACKWPPAAQNTKVVSFLSDHTVRHLIVTLAMLKLRVTMMTISPRNSEATAANLLEKTQCKLLVVHDKYEVIARAAAAQCFDVKVVILEGFDIEAMLKEPRDPDRDTLLNLNFSDEDMAKDALIIHSSGTTAFPKPICLSNRYLFNLLNWLHITLNTEDSYMDGNDCFLSCAPL